jgi:hypothetical protein
VFLGDPTSSGSDSCLDRELDVPIPYRDGDIHLDVQRFRHPARCCHHGMDVPALRRYLGMAIPAMAGPVAFRSRSGLPLVLADGDLLAAKRHSVDDVLLLGLEGSDGHGREAFDGEVGGQTLCLGEVEAAVLDGGDGAVDGVLGCGEVDVDLLLRALGVDGRQVLGAPAGGLVGVLDDIG